jgi:hypothetical protein
MWHSYRCQRLIVPVMPLHLQIASWLASRALQLDMATGQLPAALQLLEFAVDKGYGAFQVLLPQDSRHNISAVVVGDGGAHPGQQVAEGASGPTRMV